MHAGRQPAQNSFRRDDGEQVGGRGTGEGGGEKRAAGPDQFGAGFEEARQIGNMLNHFQCQHAIETLRFERQLFGANMPVIDGETQIFGM